MAGLSRATKERGHSVDVVLPFYQCLPEDKVHDLQHVMDFDVPKVCHPVTVLEACPQKFWAEDIDVVLHISQAEPCHLRNTN